jgi:hypothetical protein
MCSVSCSKKERKERKEKEKEQHIHVGYSLRSVWQLFIF